MHVVVRHFAGVGISVASWSAGIVGRLVKVSRSQVHGFTPNCRQVAVKLASRGTGQVFWTTADDKGFHRDRSATFEPKHDGEWHEYAVKLPVEKALTALRFDPSTAPGEVRLDSIKLKDKDGKAIRSWPAPPAEKK